MEEKERFEQANERFRKEAERENGRDMADLGCRPAILAIEGIMEEVLEVVVDGGKSGRIWAHRLGTKEDH